MDNDIFLIILLLGGLGVAWLTTSFGKGINHDL